MIHRIVFLLLLLFSSAMAKEYSTIRLCLQVQCKARPAKKCGLQLLLRKTTKTGAGKAGFWWRSAFNAVITRLLIL